MRAQLLTLLVCRCITFPQEGNADSLLPKYGRFSQAGWFLKVLKRILRPTSDVKTQFTDHVGTLQSSYSPLLLRGNVLSSRLLSWVTTGSGGQGDTVGTAKQPKHLRVGLLPRAKQSQLTFQMFFKSQLSMRCISGQVFSLASELWSNRFLSAICCLTQSTNPHWLLAYPVYFCHSILHHALWVSLIKSQVPDQKLGEISVQRIAE